MSKFVDIRTKQNIKDSEVHQKKHLSKKKFKKFLGTLCCVAALFAWGVIFFQQQTMMNNQKQEKAKIEQEIESQKQNIEDKKGQINDRDRSSYIEELARKQLRYIKDDETVFLPVETAEK